MTPYLKQWTQPDPIVPDPRIPADRNRYACVRNNPASYSDPSGEFPVQCQCMPSAREFERCVLNYYHVEPTDLQALGIDISGAKGCYSGRINYRAPGYHEGVGGFLATFWAGLERVYSFSRMERGDFYFVGAGISDSAAGVGLADYAGIVLGIRSDRPLAEAYRGLSLTGEVGASFPIGRIPINIGSGITGFKSVQDPQLWGATFYVGGTLAHDVLPLVDIGGALVQYTEIARSERLYGDGERVNRAALLGDLITSHPLWVVPFNTVQLVPRVAAATAALYYAWVYEELAALAH